MSDHRGGKTSHFRCVDRGNIEEVLDAVSHRTNFFADETAKVSKVTMATVAEDIDRPCAWMRMLTPSVTNLEETLHWDFIGFRDVTTEAAMRFGKLS
jgi:hypothetical protein